MGIIEAAETQTQKVLEVAKHLKELLKQMRQPTWTTVDSNYVVAKQIYALVRTKLMAEASALPEV